MHRALRVDAQDGRYERRSTANSEREREHLDRSGDRYRATEDACRREDGAPGSGPQAAGLSVAAYGDELRSLFSRNLQANLKLLDRAGGVLREASRAAREPRRLRGADAKALIGDLLQLQLDYCARLSEQSVQYLDTVVALAEQAIAPSAAIPDTAASATVLSGHPGETLAFQFALDNPNEQPVNAAIESREWLARDGTRVAADSLSFEPAATVVEPKANCAVLGRIHIDDRFVPGVTYDTLIRVAGFPGREVAITLAVGGAATSAKAS